MTQLTVTTIAKAPIATVWKKWNTPEDITQWGFASDDRECPTAENNLTVGGKFVYRMAAKDGSAGFDFSGIYDTIVENKLIEYSMEDGRKVNVHFEENSEHTTVTVNFDPEDINALELQQQGRQAILDNFKKHVEAKQ